MSSDCAVTSLQNAWHREQALFRMANKTLLLQVKAKLKEVQLHKDSPLGDTVLECYSSGSRNVFALGFVSVKSEHTVVLLSRDTQPNASGIKDLDVDLSNWEALISNALLLASG